MFDAVYLGHLGHYHCPSCGRRRPSPTVRASSVSLEGVRGARFRLSVPAGEAEVKLSLPGLYNVYNALAAAALAVALEVPLQDIVTGLQSATAAFGRAETVTVDGRDTQILLVKNPAGRNEVLRTLALEPGEHDMLGVLNDNIADGRDVSWIWDADYELLAGRVRSATCSGTRAPELALRLKYAGIDPHRIKVIDDLERALRSAAADRPGHGRGEPLYVLPTYTAMLALRELLVATWRGRQLMALSVTGGRTLRVCALYPDLMNIYADRGNLLVLQRRCEWRGIGFELAGSGLGESLDAEQHDIFYIGGGQDRDQRLCAEDLLQTKRASLHEAAARGAVVLGVCGGYQLLGHAYAIGEEEIEGVGFAGRVDRPRSRSEADRQRRDRGLPRRRDPTRGCWRDSRTTAGAPVSGARPSAGARRKGPRQRRALGRMRARGRAPPSARTCTARCCPRTRGSRTG